MRVYVTYPFGGVCWTGPFTVAGGAGWTGGGAEDEDEDEDEEEGTTGVPQSTHASLGAKKCLYLQLGQT